LGTAAQASHSPATPGSRPEIFRGQIQPALGQFYPAAIIARFFAAACNATPFRKDKFIPVAAEKIEIVGFLFMAQTLLNQRCSRSWESHLQIESAILRYVVQHPAAKDTVEGIAEWWLLEAQVSATVAEVKMALEKLVSRGRMAAEQHTDGRIYYNQAKPCKNDWVTKRDNINSGRTNGKTANQKNKI
jgi:hypothetical protein